MDFSSVLGTLRNERNHHYIMSFARRDVKFEAVDVRYRSFAKKLTDYAPNCVKTKIVLAETVKFDIIQVGENTYKLKRKCDEFIVTRRFCTCNFLKKIGLHCEHVLALRIYFDEPVFDSNLIHQQWTKEYYQSALGTRFKTSEDSVEKVSINVSSDQERCTLTQAQKFKKINKICQQIASVVSESGMRKFNKKYKQLKYLLELWQKGEEACIEGVRKRNETEFMYGDGDDNDVDDKVDDDSTDTIDITAKVKVENDNSSPKHLSPNDFDTTEFSTKLNDSDHKCNPLKNIKMPENMKKRGGPKGVEVTVVGLPRKKAKTNDKILSFSKLSPLEKDRAIIECMTEKLTVNAALHGLKLIREEDLVPTDTIPDTIRDTENIDINRVERYFENSAWTQVLKMLEKKKKGKMDLFELLTDS